MALHQCSKGRFSKNIFDAILTYSHNLSRDIFLVHFMFEFFIYSCDKIDPLRALVTVMAKHCVGAQPFPQSTIISIKYLINLIKPNFLQVAFTSMSSAFQ